MTAIETLNRGDSGNIHELRRIPIGRAGIYRDIKREA
jgi:hypothetical protein